MELAGEGLKPVAQIAKDLGISESGLRRWMAQADVCPESRLLDFPRFPGLFGFGDHATAAGAVWWRWRYWTGLR